MGARFTFQAGPHAHNSPSDDFAPGGLAEDFLRSGCSGRFRGKGFMARIILSIGVLIVSGATVYGQSARSASSLSSYRAFIDQYCVLCHDEVVQSGGLTLTQLDLARIDQNAAEWEKVVRQLRAGMMPPAGMPRPDAAETHVFVSALETALDEAAVANPNPGTKPIHRLNRAEYANSIRDLLALEIDPAEHLPPDAATHGFDNMAEVLNMSATLLEGYVRTASKISRLAVGDPGMSPIEESYQLPQGFSQMEHVEGTPFGTRGGLAVKHFFPLDGEYVFKIKLYHLSTGPLFGQTSPGEQIEVAINGCRVALLDINPSMKPADDIRTPPIRVKAGPKRVSAAFIQRAAGPVQDFHTPFDYALSDLTTGSILGFTGLPHLKTLNIGGPFEIEGPGDTPSRRKIFICKPETASEELACASTIVASFARQAYRRPVTEEDLDYLIRLYHDARAGDGFEAGIRMAVQAILADPEFVFRFERQPTDSTPGTNFRVTELELASRISYFLWSSAPDQELRNLASEEKLRDPAVLEQQVRRMLSDPRSKALATNFAGQWLFLRNLKDVQPDNYIFLDFDVNLREAMLRETELLFDAIVREDRDVLELLNADYTFVNERLARHYGIPNVQGNQFTRVQVRDENRKGLLGHGSVLTLTSMSNRTSPVMRGKWVLENILGVHPPPPPANVPEFKEDAHGEKLVSVRERLEQHWKNPTCAGCHKMMDPIGFSLENFDAVGAWRVSDNGFEIDASGQLVDGTLVDGPASLRRALLAQSETFSRTFTEKLLTYALGRGLEFYDMPVVRSIVREAAQNDNRFSAFALGIVKSVPFQMKRTEASVSVDNP